MFSVIMWHLLAAVILIRGYQAPPRNQQYTTTHQHQQCVLCRTVSTLKRFKYDVPSSSGLKQDDTESYFK